MDSAIKTKIELAIKIAAIFLGFAIVVAIMLIWRDARKYWKD